MDEQRKVFYIRRAIFLLVGIVVAVPLVVSVRMPMIVSRPTQDLYDVIDALPPDKIAIISANWDPGTQGENGPQTTAIIHHLLKRGKRFAIWSMGTPVGPELAQKIAESIAPKYGREYGVDWVNWGLKVGGDPMLRGFAENIPGIVKEDVRHTPVTDLKKLPVMQGIKSARDIGILVEFTGSNSIPSYVRYLNGIHGTPLGYACTGVMAPEGFPYYDAGQVKGILRGLAGAAEYEKLVGFTGDATKRMSSQSFAHLLIIVLIVAGNVGYLLRKRADAKRGSKTAVGGPG